MLEKLNTKLWRYFFDIIDHFVKVNKRLIILVRLFVPVWTIRDSGVFSSIIQRVAAFLR